MIARGVVASCVGCSRDYRLDRFDRLPQVGLQETGIPGYGLDLRNCGCGSTIGAPYEVAGGRVLGADEWVAVERIHDGAAP